jgi:diguanylate cyclase (GGDEF)-like protein
MAWLKGPHKRRATTLHVLMLLVALLCFGPVSPGLAKTSQQVTLQLDGDHQFRYAGYYAALWNGYYESAGLDVRIRSVLSEIGASRDVIRSVVHGDADFGLAGAELLIARDQGDPVAVLAVVLQRSGVELYTDADNVVSAPVDIQSLKINPTADPALKLYYQLLIHNSAINTVRYNGKSTFEKESASDKESAFRKEGEPASSEQSGGGSADHVGQVARADASFGDSLIYPYEAMQSNEDVRPVKLEHHGVDLPGSSIFTSQDVLDNKPDLVEAFVLASLRGWQYALQNSDEIAMRLTRERLAVGYYRELFGINFYQIDKVRELTMYPIVPLGNNSTERWERAHQQLRAAGLVTQPFSAEHFIYDPVKSLKERAERTEYWIKHGFIMFVSFLLLAGAAYWSYWLQQRKSARQLYREANFDTLTGLPNRTATLRYLSDAITSQRTLSRTVSVFFIDLDGFKRVNDNFGHFVGDLLLCDAATRLNNLSVSRKGRCEASHVARLGGDEFLIIANDMTFVEIQSLAELILDSMSRVFRLAGKEIHIGASVGIATVWSGCFSADTLLQRADAAMYLAKTSGRNQYKTYDSELGNTLQEKSDLEKQLSSAIDRGELSVHYQPIVSMQDRRVTGAEALLRWHNGKLGSVPPDRFIPVAEESGLIADIGHWVLQTSLQQLKVWQQRIDQEFELSINISPRQFNDAFFDLLLQCTHSAGVKPETVKLEITEGLLASYDRETTVLLQNIAEAGFSVSIDDFGTGYSSLNYLRHFPANTLKVDRSFVSELFNDERNQALVMAIVGMAHSLGMRVIAEGIETLQQEQFLRQHQCDYVQGYLYGKPMCADTFTELLQNAASVKSTQIAMVTSLADCTGASEAAPVNQVEPTAAAVANA